MVSECTSEDCAIFNRKEDASELSSQLFEFLELWCKFRDNILKSIFVHVTTLRVGDFCIVPAVPVAEYQEWPFQDFLKCTRIGDDVTYNLEFKLPSISEHFHLPINPAALDINHDSSAHSKIHQAPLKPKRSKVPWTEEEDAMLLRMWNEDRSWEYIFAASLAGVKGLSGGRPFLNWRSGHCFIDVGAPVSEKVEPSSSGDNNDSSDGDPESSSDYDGCSSETEVLGVNHALMILCLA
ncbi:hypothetical protein V8E51_013920 [Hyaloscypha variabilis]